MDHGQKAEYLQCLNYPLHYKLLLAKKLTALAFKKACGFNDSRETLQKYMTKC